MATEGIQMMAGMGSLWIQPDGPNTEPIPLGCHLVGDIDIPLGDKTLVTRRDPSGPSRYETVKIYRSGEPGAVTFPITTDVKSVMDVLETLNCDSPLYILMSSCGRMDVWGNYDRMFIFHNTGKTAETLSNLVSREAGDETVSEQTFTMAAEYLLRASKLVMTQLDTTHIDGLNDVYSCQAEQCAGPCGVAKTVCEEFFAVGGALSGSPTDEASIIYTEDSGGAFATMAADPFDAGEDIASGVCFEMGRDSRRYLVIRGTTDAGAPAEVAYSDDEGATWVNVNLGTPNGDYATGPQSLFAFDMRHIWCCTTSGYIFFSKDGGVTWTPQSEGVLTVNDLNAIKFYSKTLGYCVGAANTIMKTEDGGNSWTLLTGPVAQAGVACTAVHPSTEHIVFVGYGDSDLYSSLDGGVTWAENQYGQTTGTIADIDGSSPYCIFVVHNTAGPVGTVYYSRNGGFDWETPPTVTNVGINAVQACGCNLAYVVGEPVGGYSFIGKVYGE